MDASIVNLINQHIHEQFELIDPAVRDWVKAHIVEPHIVMLSIDPDGQEHREFYLVTGRGQDDASYRIAYDPLEQNFGLEWTTDQDIQWYTGAYGSFAETANSI